jgi:2-dehydropantoate 2-reductase
MKTRILIIGQGTIGTFLGCTLAENDDVVHYIRNPQHARATIQLKFHDRRSKHWRREKGATYNYNVITNLSDFNTYHYVFVSVKYTAWKEVISRLALLLKNPQTLILSGNMWDEFEWLNSTLTTPFVFAFPNFGGAIVEDKLEGWLTPRFTIGITNLGCKRRLDDVSGLLINAGFAPREENNIKGWLQVHFAYNAGMLAVAAKYDGFQKLSKKWSALKEMYKAMREWVEVVKMLGINVSEFPERREVFKPLWLNVLKTYLMFCIPGLARSADQNKNLVEWRSYAQKVLKTARENKISTSLLDESNFSLL